MHHSYIFVNNSTGELDWIVPYVRSVRHEDVHFYVIFNFPVNQKERVAIYERYFGGSCPNVQYIEVVRSSIVLALLDRFMDGFLRRVSAFNYNIFMRLRSLIDGLRHVVGVALKSSKDLAPDAQRQRAIIFRDYNLKDSFALSALRALLPHARIVVYPHSTAIQANNSNTPKRPPKQVECDLVLENTELSTNFSDHFPKQFLAVGVPLFDTFFQNEQLPTAKSMLFLTRNCDPRFFGFDLADALIVFENACRWAATHGFTMFVKHHPRDLNITEWRSVQQRYPCVEEISMSLNDVEPSFNLVLTFYTSAGLLFCARSIPVFDVTPYKGSTAHLPFHYINAEGEISHDLVEYGFYKQCQVSELPTDGEALLHLGTSQRKRVYELFPKSTNKRIYEACEQLFVGDLNA